MVILMKPDKTLAITKDTRLYQKESVVDKILFYINQFYEEHDLSEFTAAIYYINQGNDAFTELLQSVESDKEGFLEYKLPVDTRFTQFAGPVTLMLSFVKNDEDTNTKYVLHSSQLTINILKWEDFFSYVPNEALSAIDNRILELDAKADQLKSLEEELDMKTPDDLKLTEDILQLSKNGQPIGNGVEILVPGDPDDEDADHDGVIDLDDIPTNGVGSSNGLTFIEL